MPWFNVVDGKKMYRFCGYCGKHFDREQEKHLCDRCISNNVTNPCTYLNPVQWVQRVVNTKTLEQHQAAVDRLAELVKGLK